MMGKGKRVRKKMKKKEFDFNDFLEQMGQMKKLGGLNEIMKMLPGNMGGLSTGKLDDNMVDEGREGNETDGNNNIFDDT